MSSQPSTGRAPDDTVDQRERSGRNCQPLDPRVELAAERTLLAWVRTTLAIMGLGFVLARFGGIAVAGERSVLSVRMATWLGSLLVTAGALAAVAAVVDYQRLMGQLRSGELLPPRQGRLTVVVALGVAALGGITAAVLLLNA